MTSLPVLVVLACTVVLLVAAGALVVARDVPLEGPRWLAALATARGVRDAVPFHPLGRLAERKVGHPTVEALPGAPLAGEPELLDRLALLPDVRSRWHRLHHEEAEVVSPHDAPDPGRWLGPRFALARSDDRAAVEAEARLAASWLFLAGGRAVGVPSLAAAFAGFATVVEAAAGDDLDAAVARLRADLAARVPEDRAARFLVAAEGDAAAVLLRALVDEVPFRDRVAAVVLLAGVVGGWAARDGPLGEARCRDWNEANLRHARLDTEAVRRTPWITLGGYDPGVDPPGLPGLGLAAQRLPAVGFEGREDPFVEPVDLGASPVATWGDARVAVGLAGALRHLAALWALARAP